MILIAFQIIRTKHIILDILGEVQLSDFPIFIKENNTEIKFIIKPKTVMIIKKILKNYLEIFLDKFAIPSAGGLIAFPLSPISEI
ncbi:MAG: hypothetical protein IPN89_02335 [Saprospiraceae bacterium]|nr:hypothetical protein [Saprospiraceae bacterium]